MSDTELKSCMTLDEAIEHCKEKADCTKCGMEHQQLAEWLIELKSRRNAMERIVEQIVEQKQIVAKMKELFALNQKMNQELLQAKKYASQLMESVLQKRLVYKKLKNLHRLSNFIQIRQHLKLNCWQLPAARFGRTHGSISVSGRWR